MARTRIRKTVLVARSRRSSRYIHEPVVRIVRNPPTIKRARVSLDPLAPRDRKISERLVPSSLFAGSPLRVSSATEKLSRPTATLTTRSRGKRWGRRRNDRVVMIGPRDRDERFARFHPGDQRNTVDINTRTLI